ncbi:MAG: sulfatase-like hydrolase/transferase, partial [Planctomycetota bacterium]|nr:sulfatase-like hydrolase/transferase [Planctomycetota bacterium]
MLGLPPLNRICLALALFAAGGCSESETTPTRPDVVLVVVDTLRNDRLGCYGYDRPTSPKLDALAAQGVVCEDVTAQWPW